MSPKDRPPAVDVFSPQRLAKERQDAAVPPGSPPSPPPPSDAATAFMRHQGNRSDALAGLVALDPSRRSRPSLPPADAVEPYDARLADLIRGAVVADSEAASSAQMALDAQPGGPLFRAAVEAEAERVADHLARGKSLPFPDDKDSPLRGHLVEVAPQLITLAYQDQAAAQWHDRACRDCSRSNRKLRDRLSEACDDLERRIEAEWAAAEATGLRGRYETGRGLAREWSQAAALFRWCEAPDRPYTPPSRPTFPARFDYAEYAADRATGGKERPSPPLPPDEAAQMARFYTAGPR
jgi:hypothetical protein